MQDEPAISQAERASAREHFPPVVYVPAARVSGDQGPEIELRPLEDGRVALLVYTALDRLARGLGPQQPWVLLPAEKLSDIAEVARYDVIHVDLELPREIWSKGGRRG